MPSQSIVDVDALVEDLRLVVAYAAKAGMLNEKGLFDSLDAAEEALADPHKRDVKPVVEALNDAVRAIAPMTVADLRFGRDPFLESNQRKSRTLQFWLTVFSLLVLFMMGHFMQALHQEQEALLALEQNQNLDPQQKLTALRKMAQWERPLAQPSTLNEQYHQRVGELLQINGRVVSTYTTALAAYELPLFPLGNYFSGETLHRLAALFAPAAADVPTQIVGADTSEPAQVNEEICTVEDNGDLRLPATSVRYPAWMQAALRDALTDFCFQVKVVTPGGGELTSQSLSRLTFVSWIKEKVSLRVNWFLPFLYGLLGSAVYMMRNVASVRTPAVEWFPVVMRICLGGVAGIVIGWFWSANSLNLQGTSALSLPFALAFLTGYGIDVLFNLLDRFNRTIGSAPTSAARA